MRIEYPHRHERFGAVRLHALTQVIELDSEITEPGDDLEIQGRLVSHVPPPVLGDAQRQMAVVVPSKNERRRVIEGVLSGIPHECLIILVSASDREPIDRYEIEHGVLERFCHAAERSALCVHQDDPALGEAVAAGGFEEMVAESGLLRRGKGEGMIVGTMLAWAAGKESVGFVDADNYVPGAVNEYVKAYAASLHLAQTPYAMARISWQSKPKIEGDRLVFNRWGRTSQVTNQFLNSLLTSYTGFGTDVIVTGNAGEHAMTLDLALRLRWAGGFAVEPYQLIDLFEQFGGVLPATYPEVARALVDVFQVETRNPHFHENKGTDHISGMQLEALRSLYHSKLCPDEIRGEIIGFLQDTGAVEDGTPVPPRVYRPLEELDLDAFLRTLRDRSTSFAQIQRRRVAGVEVDWPIP